MGLIIAGGQHLKKMGVYAETSAQVVCANSKVAQKVVDILKKQNEKSDENYNSFAEEIERDKEVILFKASSGRVQNLEWRIGKIWETIKNMKGVVELQAPMMVENGGLYFSAPEKPNHILKRRNTKI